MSKKRRMPNGDSTSNVGDLDEMESRMHHVLKVKGEVDQLGLE